jgi:hypothetical protein
MEIIVKVINKCWYLSRTTVWVLEAMDESWTTTIITTHVFKIMFVNSMLVGQIRK